MKDTIKKLLDDKPSKELIFNSVTLNDNYYHCPFCDKKLNSVKEIEETDKEKVSKIKLKSCNCEKWLKRQKKYETYLKTKTRLEKLEKEMLKGTELPFKEDRE